MSVYLLKSRFQGLLRPLVRRMYALGMTANQVTIAACTVSIAIGVALFFTPRILFATIPLWMFARMALNAVDGMLAREFGQKSPLGAFLNEISDVVSDAALYLPFALVPPFDVWSVGAVIFAATVSEMTGVVSVMNGASRRYDGPMGKSDRAVAFSLLALWIAVIPALPQWANAIMWAIAGATVATIANRMRMGVREAATEHR